MNKKAGNLSILSFASDFDGCWHFRCDIPNRELVRFGVTVDYYCFLPSDPLVDQFTLMCEMIKQYDLVIVQRCYLYPIVHAISVVCQFLGIPLIFETDDDYINLIPSNPAFFAICDDQDLFRKFYDLSQAGKVDEAQMLVPELLRSRNRGLEGYKQLLGLVDYVTVTTEELARSIYPFNKNVMVFPNNIERVHAWRDSLDIRQCLIPTGEENKFTIKVPATLGLHTIPSYEQVSETSIRKIPRIGYTGTPSHVGEDFNTIKDALNKFHTDHADKNDHFLVMYGDIYFHQAVENKNNLFHIPPTYPYEKYDFNLRNIDIMLAPLAPIEFNCSKSEIKALESSSWGNCSLLPRYITYSRSFIDEETCLMYGNQEEFISQLERLVGDFSLRTKLGVNALEYVYKNRRECLHAEGRFNFYSDLVKQKKPLSLFKPIQEEVNVSS